MILQTKTRRLHPVVLVGCLARQFCSAPLQDVATTWLHKMPTRHAPSTFNCRVKPAFLLPHDLSFPVGLAPLPALSPRRCKQGWYNARGEGLRVRGHAGFMQR